MHRNYFQWVHYSTGSLNGRIVIAAIADTARSKLAESVFHTFTNQILN